MHTFVSVHSTHSKGELVVREVRVIAPLRNKTADALLSSTPPASDSVPGAGAAFLSRQGGRAEGAGAASELDADHLGEVADRLGAANFPVLPRIPAGAGLVVWRGHLAGAADLPGLEIEQRRAPPICGPVAVVSNSVDSV